MPIVDSRPAVRAPGTMPGRVAALAGAVSFVLILISATMLSNSPSATASGQKILSYLALHHGRLQIMAGSKSVPCSPPWRWPPRWCGRPGCSAP